MHVCFFQTSLGFAWKSCVARFSLVFQHFGLWRCQLQVLTGDTAFSDDAQVPHLSQWFFLALGMELLHLCSRIWWIIMHHTIFAKTSHLWRTIYKPRILFQPRGLEHKLLGMFGFSLNHSLGEDSSFPFKPRKSRFDSSSTDCKSSPLWITTLLSES